MKKLILVLLLLMLSIILVFLYIFLVKKKYFITFKEFDKIVIIQENKIIPKILVRTSGFDKNKLPKPIKDVLEITKKNNPEYTQIYLDNGDVIEFIGKYYPEYMNDYDSVIPGAFKADIFRLLFLYKYGGIYNDIGHIFLKKVKYIVSEDDEFIMVKDYEPTSCKYCLHNAFIAVYPRHPMIKYMIEFIIKNIRTKSYGTNPLDITGPTACGRAFNEYFNKKEDEDIYNGNCVKNGNKIKLYDLSSIRSNKIRYVIDGGQEIIKTKFDNYYKILYHDNNEPHYGDYWKARSVYKN